MEMRQFRRVLVEAAAVALAASTLALAVNAVRSDGLPLVARVPYEVLVPCPEPGGEVNPLEPTDPVVASPRTFLIDARALRDASAAPGPPGAVSIPYDWLDPIPEADMTALARAIASSRATRVVVFGDGGRPDSGEHLGREIAGRGIKNVAFVRGGARALAQGGSR